MSDVHEGVQEAAAELMLKCANAGRGWTTLEPNEEWVQLAVAQAKELGAPEETHAQHILDHCQALANEPKQPTPMPEPVAVAEEERAAAEEQWAAESEEAAAEKDAVVQPDQPATMYGDPEPEAEEEYSEPKLHPGDKLP